MRSLFDQIIQLVKRKVHETNCYTNIGVIKPSKIKLATSFEKIYFLLMTATKLWVLGPVHQSSYKETTLGSRRHDVDTKGAIM